MKVDKETIEYVANLARLRLSEKEKEKLALDLESIISYVDKLNELDTFKNYSNRSCHTYKKCFRDDEVRDSYPKDKMLMNAPEKEDGCFKVPKVVE